VWEDVGMASASVLVVGKTVGRSAEEMEVERKEEVMRRVAEEKEEKESK